MRVWVGFWGVSGWNDKLCWSSVYSVAWSLPYDFIVDDTDIGEVEIGVMIIVEGVICD